MEPNFEDFGLFYASQWMINKQVAMSTNTAIIYNIADAENVKILGLASPVLIKRATKDIKDDSGCWFGYASVITGKSTLIWEY